MTELKTGLNKIDESIVANPKKGEFYYWKGRLLLNSESEDKIEQALEVYKKAVEVDETIYYVYYDIGLIYFLQGQDLFTQAGTEKDKATRDLMNDLATEKYNSAIPMLENALKYNEEFNEIMNESLDTLKRIYYRLQMTDEYEETDKRLNEMKNR
jgi:tetratricopeptide (TPR) repeat protein